MEEKWLKVQIKVNVPETMTDKELLEWARYNLGFAGSISGENPLVNEELEPIGGWVDIDL